jgi:hypothetical protein
VGYLREAVSRHRRVACRCSLARPQEAVPVGAVPQPGLITSDSLQRQTYGQGWQTLGLARSATIV